MRFEIVALLLLAPLSLATRTGDESFGAVSNGLFYVFADKTIQVISPSNATVIKNITLDQSGAPLTNNGSASGSSNTSRTWNDVAYNRGSSSGLSAVAANEADVYSAADGSLYGFVTVLNTAAQKVIARVRVGAMPVHLYTINQTASFWSHSDGEGTFYVIPANSSSTASVATTVKAFQDTPGHGKLVYNNALYPIGYGTNVNEAVLPKFNLSTATKIGSFPFNQSLPNATLCTGTHTAVYSRVNKHAFFECIGGGGILEWNTVNDTYVALHPLIGVVTGAPADDLIFVGSNVASNAKIIVPGVNGKPSTAPGVLSIPFNPAYPQFYSSSTDPTREANFSEYSVFFPLTRNTNVNNIKSAGNNVTTLSYMIQPTDCQYGGTVQTLSLSDADGDEPQSSSAPGLTLASSANGSLATPQCGACAPGINTTDPSQFNTTLSGLGGFNLTNWITGVKNSTTTLISAGATLPKASFASGANQCAFQTSNYRALKRGGTYLATIARLPQDSLYLVNAANAGITFARTAANPVSIAWAPNA